MKTKYPILALVAIVFAAGSAFTTKKYLANNVRVWWQHTSGSPFLCVAVPLECANMPTGDLCVVAITKADTNVEIVKAFSNTLCTLQLRHILFNPFAGAYDPGAGNRPFDVANTKEQ